MFFFANWCFESIVDSVFWDSVYHFVVECSQNVYNSKMVNTNAIDGTMNVHKGNFGCIRKTDNVYSLYLV